METNSFSVSGWILTLRECPDSRNMSGQRNWDQDFDTARGREGEREGHRDGERVKEGEEEEEKGGMEKKEKGEGEGWN